MKGTGRQAEAIGKAQQAFSSADRRREKSARARARPGSTTSGRSGASSSAGIKGERTDRARAILAHILAQGFAVQAQGQGGAGFVHGARLAFGGLTTGDGEAGLVHWVSRSL
jgi:hypothetical protein